MSNPPLIIIQDTYGEELFSYRSHIAPRVGERVHPIRGTPFVVTHILHDVWEMGRGELFLDNVTATVVPQGEATRRNQSCRNANGSTAANSADSECSAPPTNTGSRASVGRMGIIPGL